MKDNVLKTTSITDELLQAVFNYLNERPRREVNALCVELERQFIEGNTDKKPISDLEPESQPEVE